MRTRTMPFMKTVVTEIKANDIRWKSWPALALFKLSSPLHLQTGRYVRMAGEQMTKIEWNECREGSHRAVTRIQRERAREGT